MASWKSIKWDDNKSLDKFSYRITQIGKALGLNDQHILDTFKLGWMSNAYINLVHVDAMQTLINLAKRVMSVSDRTSPSASAISNTTLMEASGHDGLASGTYEKPDIPKQISFQDLA